MASLFDRDVKTIGKHVKNAIEEELEGISVVANFATTASDGKIYDVEYYSLDVIISVGYRVKSKRGIEFRKWANSVLKQYILKGYAANDRRLEELRQTLQIIRRTENQLDTNQILSVIEQYTYALDLLDDYDHLSVKKPQIFCILSQRIIPSVMVTKELPQQCFFISSIKMDCYSRTVSSRLKITSIQHLKNWKL